MGSELSPYINSSNLLKDIITMKRLTLSVITLVLAAAAFAPVAQASVRSQVSTREELGEDATFVELVRFNRDARNRN